MHAQTARAESFALKKAGDGVWAGVAAARYKVNNAAVIMLGDALRDFLDPKLRGGPQRRT